MIKSAITSIASAGILFAGASFAAAVPVDLSTWMQDGNGSWTLAADNESVFQSSNSPPTVYHNGENSQGKALRGTITVESGTDDDFIGFVLGYNQGDIDGQAGTDYILIDWKQGSQAGWDAGMAISRVTGGIQSSGVDTNADQWQHTGNVEFLTRANNLGNTGWVDGQTYDFEIEFTSTLIRVLVDGNLELEIMGAFNDGAFGFYNFSQPGVRYAGITEEVLGDPVPLPAALPLMAAGLGVLGAARRRKSRSQ